MRQVSRVAMVLGVAGLALVASPALANEGREARADESVGVVPPIDASAPPGEPALSITKEVHHVQVLVGQPISYGLIVTNIGTADLTGVDVRDPGAPECDRLVGTLPRGSRRIITCTYTPTTADAGTYTNTATVTSDQTDVVSSNNVDVIVLLRHAPDLALKLANNAFVGVDEPGPGPVGQTIPVTLDRGSVTTFFLRIENAGDEADDFDLRRVDTSPGVRVRYFRGRTATDLTDAIVTSAYRTRVLAPGESVLIRVEVTVGGRASGGSPRTVTLRSHSALDPSYVDSVRIALRIR